MRSALFLILALVLVILESCQMKRKLPEDSIYNIPELKHISTEILNDSSNALLYEERGNILLDHGDDSLALIDFITASELDTASARYRSIVAEIYYNHGDVNSATKWYKKALQTDPYDSKANLAYAKLSMILHKYEQAFRSVNLVLKNDPNTAEAYYLKGQIYDDMGNKDKAMSSYQTAIQIDPNMGNAYLKIGFIMQDKGDSLCLDFFQNAYEVDSNVLGLYAQAMYYQNHRRWEDAKKKYKESISFNPSFSHPYYNMGYIYLKQDSLDLADEYFNLCLSVDQAFGQAYYQRGIIAKKKGDQRAAKTYFKQALVADSTLQEPKKELNKLP